MEQPLLIFVSSVISGMEAERAAVRAAIQAIPLTRSWLFEESPASSLPLDESYLSKVRGCDIFVLLLGDRVTDPVKKEVQTATDEKKPRLVFLRKDAPDAVVQYARSLGRKYKDYTGADDLPGQIEAALNEEIRDGYLAGRFPGEDIERAKAYLDRQRQSETNYLNRILQRPEYSRLSRQFVPLAGTLTPLDEFGLVPRQYSLRTRSGEGAAVQVRTIPLKDVAEALDQHSALALLGEPGCGKTTQLHKLARDAAEKRVAGRDGMLPVFASLNDFPIGSDPYSFIQTALQRSVGNRDLRETLQDDRLLLLCDALNEMPFEGADDRTRRVGAWRRFADDLPSSSRLVISCRRDDYLLAPLGLPEIEIKDLDDGRVQDFLGKYLPDGDLAKTVWDRLAGDPLLEMVRNPFYLRALCLVAAQQGNWPANRAGLLRECSEQLLGREAEVGHADFPGVEPMRLALSGLAEAMLPISEGTFRPRADITAAIPPHVETADGSVATPPEAVLRLGQAAMLLDKRPASDGTSVYGFYHQQLQEYFAAEALLARWRRGEDVTDRWRWPRTAREMPGPGRLGDYDLMPPPPGTRWEQSTIMAAGLAPDSAAFLRAVGRVNPALAARCLAEAGVPRDAAAAEELQTALLRDMTDMRLHLRARLAAGDALGRVGDPRFREMVISGQRVLAPPLIRIPAGKVRMGSRRWEVWRLLRQGFQIEDELTGDTVSVPQFWIGQFPVTNAEFACFVDAGGYEKKQYWRTEAARAWLRGELESAAVRDLMNNWRYLRDHPEEAARLFATWTDRNAAAWRKDLLMSEEEFEREISKQYGNRPMDRPAFLDDSRYNGATQPVVGVTWFEASAYCAWLDEQLQEAKAAGLWEALEAPPGYGFRLPTEAEWERAARMGRGWAYPWSRTWQAGHANTWEEHIARPSPVGVYPNGAMPEGVHDLSGNVWEWTRSLYRDYPYRDDGRNDPEAEGARVVRGGSWDLNQRNARCAFRFWFLRDYFGINLGFRVVLSLSS